MTNESDDKRNKQSRMSEDKAQDKIMDEDKTKAKLRIKTKKTARQREEMGHYKAKTKEGPKDKKDDQDEDNIFLSHLILSCDCGQAQTYK
jgi:hypothetical protein